jgi:hypothetical protein
MLGAFRYVNCFTFAKHFLAGMSPIGARADMPDLANDVCFQAKLAGWVEPFAKPIAFADENRWVSLRSTSSYALLHIPQTFSCRYVPYWTRCGLSAPEAILAK